MRVQNIVDAPLALHLNQAGSVAVARHDAVHFPSNVFAKGD